MPNDLEHPLTDLAALIQHKSPAFQLNVVSTREDPAGHAACLSLATFGPDGSVTDYCEQEVWLVSAKHLGSERVRAYLHGWTKALPLLISHWIGQLGSAPLAMYFSCAALLEDSNLVTDADFQRAFESVANSAPHPLYAKYLREVRGEDATEDVGQDFDHRQVAAGQGALFEAGAPYEKFQPLMVGVQRLARSGLFTLQRLYEDIDRRLRFAKDPPAQLERSLQEIAKAQLAALREAELDYPETTMNDRLERAFAQLQRSGILVSEAAGYTQDAGYGALSHLLNDATRGYVFYTEQDLERAVDGLGLYLAFGAHGAIQAEASLAIANEIVGTLAEHGVPVTWPGLVEQRIHISPFKWQKRRAPRA